MNDRELAAAYVLDELGQVDRAALERRLDQEPALRAEVEAMEPLLAQLEALPAAAWDGARGEDSRRRSTTARPAGRWSVRPALALATLIVVAALGTGLGLLIGGDRDGGEATSPPRIVLRPLPGAPSDETATVAMPAPGEMVLRTAGLPASAAGQYYELWLMSDARRTVPVASFRVGPEGTAVVRVPLPADPSGYRYFDLSRQSIAAGTQHSADSVLRGSTAAS